MSIKNKIGLFISFLIVGWVLLYGGRVVISSYGGGLVFNHSTNMDEYKFSLEGTAFCVPKAYFRFSNSFHPDSGIGLDLSMELDSFEPWNIYGERIGFFANKKSMTRQEINNVLTKEVGLNISGKRDGRDSVDEKWRFLLKDVRRQDEGKYTRLLPGKKAITYYGYFLIPKGAKDYSYIIGCVSGGRCGLESSYDDLIKYEVVFDEKYLGVVDALDARAQGFIGKANCMG